MWQLSLPRSQWPAYNDPNFSRPYLWRVAQSFPGSGDENDEPWKDDHHLVSRAAQSDPSITNRDMKLFDFLDAVEKHADKTNRLPTPFLTTFESAKLARFWARRLIAVAQRDNAHVKVTVYKIDTRKLASDVRLYVMPDLIQYFQLDVGTIGGLYPRNYSYYAKEVKLFFGRIPREAVVNVFEPGSAAGACSEQYEDQDWRDPDGTDFRVRCMDRDGGVARNVEENLSPSQIELRKDLAKKDFDSYYQVKGPWYRFCNGKGCHRFRIQEAIAIELGDIGESCVSRLTGPPCLAKQREEQPREEESVSQTQGASTENQWVLEFSREETW